MLCLPSSSDIGSAFTLFDVKCKSELFSLIFTAIMGATGFENAVEDLISVSVFRLLVFSPPKCSLVALGERREVDTDATDASQTLSLNESWGPTNAASFADEMS